MGGLSNSRGNSQKSAPVKNSHGNSQESASAKNIRGNSKSVCIHQAYPRHHLDDSATLHFYLDFCGLSSYLYGCLKLCHSRRSPRCTVDFYTG